MFDDLIKMLLAKKAEVKATDAKIDELLKGCGYVAPLEETEEAEVADDAEVAEDVTVDAVDNEIYN